MSLATEREITDLKTELARLKAENNYLRKKLYQNNPISYNLRMWL